MSNQLGTVVLIDDSEIFLETVAGALEDIGCAVVAVSEPSRSAFALDENPDLVLLDVNMPQAYGDDIARFLRDSWGLKSPLYLYSSLSESELEVRAQQAGADGYICKSWGIERLVDRVEEILRSRGIVLKSNDDATDTLPDGVPIVAENDAEKSSIAQLKQQFVERCVNRKQQLLEILLAHERGEDLDPKRSLQKIQFYIHDLVGESKLLGLSSVGSFASSIKNIVDTQREGILAGKKLRTFYNCIVQLTDIAERTALSNQDDNELFQTLDFLRSQDYAKRLTGDGEAELDDTRDTPVSNRRILIVDDSPIVGEALSMELEAKGHEVALASCLKEFAQSLASFQPELIFLDVEMPEIRGPEICRALRQHHRTKELPIIFLSSLPDSELRELAEEVGANGFLSKQHGLTELVKYLDDILAEIIF